MATDNTFPASIVILGVKIIFDKDDPRPYRLKVIGMLLAGQLITLVGVCFASRELGAATLIAQILSSIKIVKPLVKRPRDEQTGNP